MEINSVCVLITEGLLLFKYILHSLYKEYTSFPFKVLIHQKIFKLLVKTLKVTDNCFPPYII